MTGIRINHLPLQCLQSPSNVIWRLRQPDPLQAPEKPKHEARRKAITMCAWKSLSDAITSSFRIFHMNRSTKHTCRALPRNMLRMLRNTKDLQHKLCRQWQMSTWTITCRRGVAHTLRERVQLRTHSRTRRLAFCLINLRTFERCLQRGCYRHVLMHLLLYTGFLPHITLGPTFEIQKLRLAGARQP